ncbi:MAG TPA: hypothetical protein VFO25_08460 [Candidatus Eremiobacteraceae bacterium]|nr:hypothetical protein [Candidatus Eremiobacteraceae bacterium]
MQFMIERNPWMLPRASTAVEMTTRSPHDLNELEGESEDLYALLGLLNVWIAYDLWAPFLQLKKWGQAESDFYFSALIESRPPNETEYGVVLNLSDEQTFRRDWEAIVGGADQNLRLRRAVARFRRARSSWFSEDAIVHAFIGLESIFGEHEKAGRKHARKVTKRVARFVFDPDVSPSAAELGDLSERIAALYDLRHDIVHGALPDQSKTNEGAKDSIQLLRTAILIALEEGFSRTIDLVALANRYDVDLREAQRLEKRRRRQPKSRRGDPFGAG